MPDLYTINLALLRKLAFAASLFLDIGTQHVFES
jgi:hypothetical protein